MYSNVQQNETPNSASNIVFNNGYCMLFFMFSLVGLVADVWTGHYKIIVTSIYFCFFTWILFGLNFIITAYWQNNSLFYVISVFGYLCAAIRYTGFRANIVQFSIDQLVGASADKLSAIIYWHSVNVPFPFTIFEVGRCSFNFFLILSFITSGVIVSVVLITHSFLNTG